MEKKIYFNQIIGMNKEEKLRRPSFYLKDKMFGGDYLISMSGVNNAEMKGGLDNFDWAEKVESYKIISKGNKSFQVRRITNSGLIKDLVDMLLWH